MAIKTLKANICALIIGLASIIGCAGPSLDGASNTSDLEEGNLEYSCNGAQVFPVDVQLRVKSCLEAKRYYDRNARDGEGMCTEKKIARFGCTLEGLRSVLTSSAKVDLQTALESRLKNFRIDQCYDDVSADNLPIYKCTFENGYPASTQVLVFPRQ